MFLGYNHKSQLLASQGSEGSCTIHAVTNAIEWAYFMRTGEQISIPTEGIYKRLSNWEASQINFIQAKKAIKRSNPLIGVNQKTGEKVYIQFIHTRRLVSAATRLSAKAWAKTVPFHIANALNELKGVVIALPVCDPFTDADHFWNPNGKIVGMHAVGVVEVTPDHMRLANSWGEEFGLDGTFFIRKDDYGRIEKDAMVVKFKILNHADEGKSFAIKSTT